MTAEATSPARRAAGLGPVFGIASQLLNAGTNVATAYVASLLLRPDAFGLFVLGFACVTLALATGRGLIGSTMLAHLPAVPGPQRSALLRSAVGFGVLVGLAASAVLLVVAIGVGALVWFVPWVTFALVQDLGRHAFLADHRPGAALGLDAVWAAAQIAVVLGWWLAGGELTLGVLASAWGLGAVAGCAALAVLSPELMGPAGPGLWSRATRDVSGWFTATSVLGQAEIYLVLLLVGVFLGAADAGGVRAVQLLAFQPPMVLLGALLALATPPFARLGAGSPGLPAQWRRTLLAVTPVAVAIGLLAVLAAPLMAWLFPQYTAFTPLVAPVALQSALFAFAVPSQALLAGTRRGALAFWLHAGRTALVVSGAVLGMVLAGPAGLAWSLALTSALTLAAMTAAALLPVRPRPVTAGAP